MTRHYEVEARRTTRGTLPDRIEKTRGRRGLVRNDKDMGRF